MQTITLPAHCNRAAAAALYPELLEASGESAIEIDASKVEQLGLAMVQMLVSAARTGGGISVTNASTPFCNAVKLAKLETVINAGERP